jgi:uncharacterized membrane protein
MSISFAKVLSVLLTSMVKLILGVPLALGFGFSFWQTVLVCFFGGSMGVLFFAFFSEKVMLIYYKFFPKKNKEDKEKKETIKQKMIRKALDKYGLYGLAFLTPVFLSIPFGTFITLRYFPNKMKTLPYLFLSVFLWSLGMSLFRFI